MIAGDTDYALSRWQARSADRVRTEQWRQIGSARSVAGVLELLRAGGGARWVQGLGDCSNPHRLEAHLRARYREQIEELSGWADPGWQTALRWCARLVDLPALRQSGFTGDGAGLADWSAADLEAFALAGAERATAVDDAWLAQLRLRLPHLDADDRAEFELLLRIVADHRRRFCALPAGNGWPEREDLQHRLSTRLRRNGLSPVQLLTAAALLWLEHERVRGELVRLVALPTEPQP
jgi:hypothetical protein